ncbi:MAG: adenylate/guanylate cyclase domain-containing protein [Solirubrobacteraceae bacterium]|jgi:adenylate cyclase
MASKRATGPAGESAGLSLAQAAERAGVSPATLRRWTRASVIPQYDGTWTPEAIAHARIVAAMRARGHSLAAIRVATEEGRLAFGLIDALFPREEEMLTREQAAAQTGLEPALIARIVTTLGWSSTQAERLSADEVQLLRYLAAVLEAGLPQPAMLQLVRVYGQVMARVADAEVRLFHLYVHEPLLRSGATGIEMGEAMRTLSGELLPLAWPVMNSLHRRYLQHFVEQDVVAHMESDLDGDKLDLGRLRVAIAFADLAGYTRLTEQEGELEALGAVERFVEAVEATLPQEARVIKTVGDEVMIVGSDPAALTHWAVGFQRTQSQPPLPRIGIHCGVALYRDGDYYGRDVNIASRVAARSAGGEVLVTRPVVDAANQLSFERIAEVRLKGFSVATEIFRARARDTE